MTNHGAHTYNARNNPVWQITHPVKVTRQDNSLSLRIHYGTIDDEETGRKGNIGMVIGGLVISLGVQAPGEKSREYTIDVSDLVQEVFRMDPELAKAEYLSLFKPGTKEDTAQQKARGLPTRSAEDIVRS